MKLLRYEYDGESHWGVLEGSKTIKKINGNPFSSLDVSNETIEFSKIKLLPCSNPTKIIGIGLNYSDHIEAAGLDVPKVPYVVMRPTNTINSHQGEVILKDQKHFIQYEGELAVIIGKQCKDITPDRAGEYILGYSCANDITDKTLFREDGHFGRAKSFDTQCPIGPFIETDLMIDNITITTTVNGVIRQKGTTKNMVFSAPYLVSYLSTIMTLYPGDVILTGSPSGAGPLKDGDVVEVSIDGVGNLINKIKDK